MSLHSNGISPYEERKHYVTIDNIKCIRGLKHCTGHVFYKGYQNQQENGFCKQINGPCL